MTLDRNKIKISLATLDTSTQDKALDSWDNLFKTYFSDYSDSDFHPISFSKIKPLFKKSIESKTFIEDFGKNLLEWTSAITFANSKSESGKSSLPSEMDFKTFSDAHSKDTSSEVWNEAFSIEMHNWFSKITVSKS